MTFIEAIIIYFAVGSPFGVWFALNRPVNGVPAPVLAFAASALWVFLPIMSHKGIKSRLSGIFDASGALDSMRSGGSIEELERCVSPLLTAADNYSFRETLEVYAGLSDLMRSMDAAPADSFAFAKMSESSSATVGQVCVQRRNLRRAERHRSEARWELMDWLEVILKANPHDRRVIVVATKFFEQTGDADALNLLEALERNTHLKQDRIADKGENKKCAAPQQQAARPSRKSAVAG